LLPLYREHAPEFHGKIYFSKDGVDWEERGEIGRDGMCIQPTIWREDGKIHALLRNFAKTGLRYAWHSTSEDQGKTWGPLTPTQFWNANNSILALNLPNNDRALVVWNNDPNGRQNITLGNTRGSILARLDSYGSYPAACVAHGKLHITWTAKTGPFNPARSAIKHMEFDLNEVEKRV
jgi:predicted neuraminidase